MIGSRFELAEQIGQGGMGAVYRGIDRQSGQTIAIKQLKSELVKDPEALARFASEAEALRVLNHPNIVKVLATLQENGQQYLVMEYVEGGSLYDLLRKQAQLPVSRVLEIALDLSDALTRAHRLNIVHRDLKPANVLLTADGLPRLTDFGVARIGTPGKQQGRATESGVTVGTLDYLSPEALNGEQADARSDIWAFGVMLYEMLAGQRPFGGKSVGEVITAILTQPTPDLEAQRPDSPLALLDLVYRMLEKERQQRVPSVRQVGAELEAILQGHDTRSGLVWNQQDRRADVDRPSPTPSSSTLLKHNLPAQTTPFVGREEELDAIAKLLGDPGVRLLTLLGPGGMGKTRLGLEAAGRYTAPDTQSTRDLHMAFANGVYFVALAPISAPEFIAPAIADALRFTFYSSDEPARQLLDYLREKQVLLLLDNFEHLIAGATLLSDILKGAPGVKILVTSRERLNLQGEMLLNVGGLSFPERDEVENLLEFSVAKLFLQSARRSRPGFELAQGDLPYLARICRLVRGMPLGVELAAAWVDSLSLEEIAGEIVHNLDFLETHMQDIPERQRSVRAVFEYSWALLSDDEREVFQKLSVFRGGFLRDAGIAVAGASLRGLTGLVNKSLLSRDTDGRYGVHELLRQYAEERLQQSGTYDAVCQAHCAYFANFYNKHLGTFVQMADQAAIKLLESDLDNVRAVIRRALEHDEVTIIRQIIFALFVYCQTRALYLEAAETLDASAKMLDRQEATPVVNVTLMITLASQGWMLIRMGNMAQSKAVLERCCELIKITELPVGYQDPWSPLALVHSILGDYVTARQMAEQGLLFNLSRNDNSGAMISNYVLTSAAYGQGDYEAARKYSEQSLAYAQKDNQRWFMGYVYVDLGNIARIVHDYAAAKRYYEACYAIRREFRDGEGMALPLRNMGQVALLEGDPARGKALYEESLALYKDLGDRGGLVVALAGLGAAETALRDYPAARRHFNQALHIASDINLVPLTLSILLGFARLLIDSGEQARGLELLALAAAHPSSSQETRDEAHAMLTQYETVDPSALERGKPLDVAIHELLSSG